VRRACSGGLLRAAGLAGVAGVVGAGLAACGSSGGSATTAAGQPAPAGASDSSTETSSAMDSPTPAGSSSAATGMALGAASEIKVGGGKIFADQQVVVTQPASGTFKAFSTTCTDQGCQVSQVSGGLIECPCHAASSASPTAPCRAARPPRRWPPRPSPCRAARSTSRPDPFAGRLPDAAVCFVRVPRLGPLSRDRAQSGCGSHSAGAPGLAPGGAVRRPGGCSR
jgi:hypothetical protein